MCASSPHPKKRMPSRLPQLSATALTRVTRAPQHTRPLNEEALLDRGIPALAERPPARAVASSEAAAKAKALLATPAGELVMAEADSGHVHILRRQQVNQSMWSAEAGTLPPVAGSRRRRRFQLVAGLSPALQVMRPASQQPVGKQHRPLAVPLQSGCIPRLSSCLEGAQGGRGSPWILQPSSAHLV